MTLESGTRFGSYEVVEQIGSGGMGEVWRATDTELGRDVAVKVLPQAFVDDADRLARFKREAELLASLNHANIATIHGLEKVDGQTVIVMELVEGPTLADRIADGPIPPDEALGIARQIADALEAAHANQIVHRDLKPANVKLKDDGTVKVLDFGISKSIDPQAISGAPASLTPTVTEAGVILGTAAYMSPEQARGRFVDQRTDVWAFGCLLFEMLTGQPAFGGDDVMAILARVIDRDTDLSSMPGTISPAVRHTLKLCLEKDPKRRIADIRDVRLALAGVFESELPRSVELEATPRWRTAVGITAAIVVTAAVVGLGTWFSLQPAPGEIVRFDYDIPEGQIFRGIQRSVIALSPDGRRFVYNTPDGFYIREMGELEARLIPGTETTAVTPVFSPDGQSVAYVTADGRLRRISISGGAPVVIAEVNAPYGLSWGADGTILIGQLPGIFRVSANGGEPELVIAARDGETLYGPSILPDGDSLLFTSRQGVNWSTAEIVTESLATGERTVLVQGGGDARYVPTGHLVYVLNDGLFAVAFDADNKTVSGGPVPLLQGLWTTVGPTNPGGNFGLADNGTLIYISGGGGEIATGQVSTLTWVDSGGAEESVGMDPCTGCLDLSIAPDGTRAALTVLRQDGAGGADIWIWSFESRTLSRLTFESQLQVFPVWSPDSARIVYRTLDGIYRRPADGTGAPERLMSVVENVALYDVTTDNGVIFTQQGGANDTLDIFALDPSSEGSPRVLFGTEFIEDRPALSPDGRWIAYESDETGQREIYVRPYPDVETGKWQVSTSGGVQPIWAPDTSRLYFLAGEQLMQAEIVTEPAFSRRTPVALFDLEGFQIGGGSLRSYDVSADGERFLLMKSESAANSAGGSFQVIVVQNWIEDLKRLVPTD